MAITISGSGITSANIADGTIVNADINSSATGWAQAQLTNASNTELAVIHSRAETEMVVQPFTHIYLDSPASTSEQTYKYRLAAETAGAVWVNRMKATAFEVDVSTITVMEIAG